ncbi:MAG: alkaline phosphatase family protein [Acidobacteria bacterium]|nr:alkaline phosphatase family protein [Acidobacteriota bacterium]MDA1234581.1 alkaline phosphatase family protein [Acidobacteriota bacterium]
MAGNTQTFQLTRAGGIFAWLFAFAVVCPAVSAQAPRLTIWIVADQFRADYLQRYALDFGPDGFRRMQNEGAAFHRMRFDYTETFTSSGAATLATGAYPETHGIVADSWYDRRSGEVVQAIGERQLPTPTSLSGSSLADELNLATSGQSRIVSIADDPRLAVLLAGHRPLACLWRGEQGEIRTSSYYAPLPQWATDYDARNRVNGARREWRALRAADDAPPLRVLEGERYVRQYLASPFAVEDVFSLARAAIEGEQMGQDDVPDLLILGLGAPGLLSLETGAYSPLMRDLAVKIDSDIAALFAWLDERYLLDDTAVVFTATHGVPPRKTDVARANLPGGAVDGERLAQGVGQALGDFPGIRVEKYVFPFLSFNDAFSSLSTDQRVSVVRAAGAAALEFPGVQAFYDPEASSALGEAYRRMSNGFYAGRSGDMMLSYAPFYVEYYGGGSGTSSGSGHSYDTDVPLLLLGSWFRTVENDQIVDAASLAPTLARLLGTAMPSGASQRVLTESLAASERTPAGPPAPE